VDLTASVHDISGNSLQHMPSISEENYEICSLLDPELGHLVIQVSKASDLTKCGILIAGKSAQCVCYVRGLY
jgi:hypothetical protein